MLCLACRQQKKKRPYTDLNTVCTDCIPSYANNKNYGTFVPVRKIGENKWEVEFISNKK